MIKHSSPPSGAKNNVKLSNNSDYFDIACSNDEQKVISRSDRSETNLESKIKSGGASPTNNKSTEIVQDLEIRTNSNESIVACNKIQ